MTETGYTEDCCWTDIRQHCRGKGCVCRCHTEYPPEPTYDALTEQLARVTAERDQCREWQQQAEVSRANEFRRAADALAERDALTARLEAVTAAAAEAAKLHDFMASYLDVLEPTWEPEDSESRVSVRRQVADHRTRAEAIRAILAAGQTAPAADPAHDGEG